MSATTYSSTEVVAAVDGLTYRQLDHWVRRGYITPAIGAKGSGSRRRWSHEQVDRLQQTVHSIDLLGDRGRTYRRVLAGEVVVTEVEQ